MAVALTFSPLDYHFSQSSEVQAFFYDSLAEHLKAPLFLGLGPKGISKTLAAIKSALQAALLVRSI